MHRVTDYLFSLHFFPLGAAVALPCAAWYYGAGWLLCAALCTSSLAVSAAAFYCEPLLHLAPRGGRYNVGLRELKGDRGAMQPPLTVIYPTTAAAARNGVDYLPFNDTQYLRGMARYAGLPYVLLMDVFFTRAQMRADAVAAPLFRADGSPLPLVLFSHGLAGYPRLYSQLLMDVAARGAIIFGPTHMDASAAYCRDAGADIRIPINTAIGWSTKDREPQLEMRVRELRNTIPRIRSGELLRSIGYDADTIARYVAADPPVHLVGHSFGGATVLTAALEEEAEAKQERRASAVASVVTYDAWGVPLKQDMFLHRLTDTRNALHYSTPTLQILSEAWKRDKAHLEFFETLESVIDKQCATAEEAAVMDAANRKLSAKELSWYTRVDYGGTGHLTCTDASLFSPVVYRQGYMTVPPREAILDYANDTLSFISSIAGPIPIEKELQNGAVLAAARGQ